MRKKRTIPITTPFVGKKEWEALKSPLKNGWLTQGPCVAEFERQFAQMHGVKYAIATSSCTTALHLSLVALGIGPGSEVIVPSFTWIATANAVEYVGAKPVFCDVNLGTYNIEISQIESLITTKTKAIIPVHLFGLCADIKPLVEICKKKKVFIIEDAACAVGSSINGKKAGSFGEIGCFSFHARKIISTGEGGMCTTNDKDLAEKIICLRNHGASITDEERYSGKQSYLLPDFRVMGFNYRMTDFQGAVGLAQLSRLTSLIEGRRRWASWYKEQLKDILWLTTPSAQDGFKHTYQAFVCYVNKKHTPLTRNDIMKKLFEKGIETRPGTHAVHMQDYYAKKYNLRPEDYPVARNCQQYSLAIPLHNRMREEDYEYVLKVLREL